MTDAPGRTGTIDAEATVSWTGWGGEVLGGSGVLSVPTATQVELGGPGRATNPEELLAAALANCYTSTITARARARNINLGHVETTGRTRLAWDEATPHHIAQGALSVRIRTSAPEGVVRELAQDARDHCPICNVLGATAKVTLSVDLLPERSSADE
jgi:lipoyl-dependent peroxiredoxin